MVFLGQKGIIKSFYTVSITILICTVIISIRFQDFLRNRVTYVIILDNISSVEVNVTKNNSDDENQQMKFILLWTPARESPFDNFGEGRQVFLNKRCKWNNCYVTGNKNYLGHYTEFEAILFNGPRLLESHHIKNIPRKRHIRQKYVYANIEAVSNYPIHTNLWNGFFNWTWTYRLDSDALWAYVAIKNVSGHVIGPRTNMHWINISEMKPISKKHIKKFKSKMRAVAWFSSNCNTLSQRESLVTRLDAALKPYRLRVDIFGKCGNLYCPRETMEKCLQYLEKKYYFYLAFENALCEDYVTEKIVHALQHNTVPIVYGGANYSRFLPAGAYLDALELGPKRLAKKINDAMRQPEKYYYNFFRWKNHYSYHLRHESPDTDDYCNFCAVLNNDTLMSTTTIYDRFDLWWSSNLSYTHSEANLVPF